MLVNPRLNALALAAAVLPGCAPGDVEEETGTLTACPMTNVIDDPVDFAWTFHPASADVPEPYYSGVLEYGEATFTIGMYTLTTRAYRQAGGAFSIPGPTLRMTPGNKYVVRYHNLLPFAPASSEHNVFKDPNVSNLHTHGLNISGESPSDDVTRFFEGERGGDFVYDIPADHMGGTYWYHAHHHGSTFLQVASGAFGMIVIDDSGDGIPPNVAAMPERDLVVAYLDPAVAGTGGDTLISGTLPAGWTVNGTVQGNLCMAANEWQHWRVLLADRNATEKTFTIGSNANCEVALLARDGVWRTTAPRVLATRFVRLTGASRADLAVRCSNDSTLMINNVPIASVLVDGAGDTTVGPWSDGATGTTWSATRPDYLRDLRGETSVHNETLSMLARSINGTPFDPDVPTFTLPADQVQNWTLNAANIHPFHLHVYHVQSQNCTGAYEPGEYFDTIANACTVRFDLNAATSSVYEGRTILHCHILDHEDLGAMGWLDTVGGQPPPSYPDDDGLVSPYGESYSQGSIDWCTGDGDCGDADVCNGAETCEGGGTCAAGAPLDCDDGKACTADSCDPALGCVHTPTCPITLATDDFESGTFSGGTLWLDPAWTATGDALVLGSEGPHAGAWHARLRRATGKITRRARRKSAANVHLKFWAKVTSFEDADVAEVKVGLGAAGLVTVKTFTAADSDDQYHFYDLDLSALALPSNIKVVFDAGRNASGDLWTIDDIELSGLK
jgi:FtsP/CotA-like multicopper oxidase with cupredoxin domain